MKQWIAVALLAAASAAQAEVENFSVRYQGFYDEQAGSFNPDLILAASFSADDLDGDGTYSVDELVSFQFSSIYWNSNSTGCSYEFVVEYCLNSFSYTLGQAPSFSASMHVHDDMFPWSQSIKTGEGYSYANWGSGDSTSWRWTNSTQAYVNGVEVSPVPEPAQFGMLAIGLAGIGLLTRYRSRNT